MKQSLIALGSAVCSTAAFALTMGLLELVFHVNPDSSWYLLCWLVSFASLGASLFLGLRRYRSSKLLAGFLAVLSFCLVATANLAIVVTVSCSEGVCL